MANLPSNAAQIPSQAIRAQLDRVRNSSTFAKSERLARFLTFVVEETLAERGDTLKEQVISNALYSQDAGSDSVVRVDARRLRDKLREYYTENPGEPFIITLPKGSYVPRFENIHSPSAAPAQPQVADPRRYWIALPVAMGLTFLALLFLRPFGARRLEFTPIPLTSYPGIEDGPSLSPDGNFVAFAWTGPNTGVRHIYIKAVRGDALRQLTNGKTGESSPAWSPDAQQIAFVRNPR
jgi:hypothetical protein